MRFLLENKSLLERWEDCEYNDFNEEFIRSDAEEIFSRLDEILDYGTIVRIKDIQLYQIPDVYDESIEVSYGFKFKALLEGGMSTNHADDDPDKNWFEFDTSDLSGDPLIVSAYYVEDQDEDGIYYLPESEIADNYNAQDCYECIDCLISLLMTRGYESLYDVEDLLDKYVERPESINFDDDDDEDEEYY